MLCQTAVEPEKSADRTARSPPRAGVFITGEEPAVGSGFARENDLHERETMSVDRTTELSTSAA